MAVHSNKNTYKDSEGNRYTRKHIEDRIKAAKRLKLEEMQNNHGYIFCEDCKISSGTFFDLSHNVSVDKCLKTGKSELAWSVSNLTVRCRSCHQKHDKL